MQQRPLGNTGLKVSDISFGCVELGIPYGIGVKGKADMLPETQAVRLLQSALAEGINFFDTAPAYGSSERLLGLAFADRREQAVICTKAPHRATEPELLDQPENLRRVLRESLESSLRELRSDYVDVYLLHQATEQALRSPNLVGILREFRQEGLIRAFGASTYPGGTTGTALACGTWDVLQIAIHVMDRREEPYLAEAVAKGVGIIARSVLFKGILSDRGRTLHPALERVAAHRQRLIDALPEDLSLARAATQYILGLSGISSVLLGIDRFEYLEQALATANASPLPAPLRTAWNALPYPDPDFLNLPAWDRSGWL
jgi:aryl-alcohol dehydrogenase-like predicted oxidoreductase